jgi:hypothetical protein
MGDVDGSKSVGLEDAILSLKAAAGDDTAGIYATESADVDHDGRIGIPEALFALQMASGLRPFYYIDPFIIAPNKTEYRFIKDGHHFLSFMNFNGTCNFRPHPGFDPNGWGSSWYAQPFLPGAVLGHTIIDSIDATNDYIRIEVHGNVSRGLASTYGTWSLVMTFIYTKAEKKIVGTGEYVIFIDGQLSGTTGDLNLYKIASNYLDDVPLLSGGNGDTGDMSRADVTGSFAPYSWIPPNQPSHFPSDTTDTLSINVIGQYNNVDTAAQGYAPIQTAFKPSMKVKLISQTATLLSKIG